jgi:hypothetical protein
MKIPFTVEQFFDVFVNYNHAIWPAQVVAYAIGLAAIGLAFREGKSSGPVVAAILALFWIWMGVFYHMVHFSRINPLANIFGLFYVLQALLFVFTGIIQGKLSFRFRLEPLPLVGACFVLYAMVVYPFLGLSFGHFYPKTPMFGVAPCPTTIFTFGLLLWATGPVPAYLLIIPLVWSLIGMSAAVNLSVPQDYGLVIARHHALDIIQEAGREGVLVVQALLLNGYRIVEPCVIIVELKPDVAVGKPIEPERNGLRLVGACRQPKIENLVIRHEDLISAPHHPDPFHYCPR